MRLEFAARRSVRESAAILCGKALITLPSEQRVVVPETAETAPPRCVKLRAMEQHREFSTEEARAIGEQIGIHWDRSPFDVEQFRMGLAVELEHGRRDPSTNVSDDDEVTTGKIAWAHLNEFPDYYTRLAEMEAEAERYWSEQRRGSAS